MDSMTLYSSRRRILKAATSLPGARRVEKYWQYKTKSWRLNEVPSEVATALSVSLALLVRFSLWIQKDVNSMATHPDRH